MSNIKVGGKVFRDVEKMSLEQLEDVRRMIVGQMQLLAGRVNKLNPRNPASKGAIGQIDKMMTALDERLNRVDTIAKTLVRTDVKARLANLGEPSPEVTS